MPPHSVTWQERLSFHYEVGPYAGLGQIPVSTLQLLRHFHHSMELVECPAVEG